MKSGACEEIGRRGLAAAAERLATDPRENAQGATRTDASGVFSPNGPRGRQGRPGEPGGRFQADGWALSSWPAPGVRSLTLAARVLSPPVLGRPSRRPRES
jgi:hypothetical protein